MTPNAHLIQLVKRNECNRSELFASPDSRLLHSSYRTKAPLAPNPDVPGSNQGLAFPAERTRVL